MRRSTYSDDEIQAFVQELRAGRPVEEICRVAGVSPRTLYRWQQRFGGLKSFGVQALRRLEQENRRLRAEMARGGENVAEIIDHPPRPTLRSDMGSTSSAHRPGDRATVVGRYASLRIR